MTEKEAAGRRRSGTLCCAAGAVSWGLSGTCSQAFFQSCPVDTAWVTAVRMAAAGVILTAWAVLRGDLRFRELLKDRRSVCEILLFSLAGLTICQYAYLNAIRLTNSGTATVLQNLSIVLIAVFVCIANRRRPQKRTVFCIALALAGVWLIATGGQPGRLQLTPAGLFWGLAAAFGAASYTLLSRAPVRRWGSIPVTGLGMFAGGTVLLILLRAWTVPAGLDLRAVVLLAVIVLVGTVGAFTLFLQGISLVGPVRASLLGCLEPLTAAALSALWLHSGFSGADLLGFACILSTVLLIRE